MSDMTVAKAREIVSASKVTKGGDYGLTRFAEGYIAALEGPEVKAFLNLERMFRACKRYKNGDGVCCACSDRYFEVLSAYKKAVGR